MNNRTPQVRIQKLRTHCIVYIAVNSGLTALNLIRNPDHLWFYWPLAGWGAGLLLHAGLVWKNNRKDHERIA
ncbi:2TM domain-containing protein [Thalassoglobus sp.]|uniref:2TM domain-containing protein n=1 Tax=Thalassoglobus sp. TaxID=2795869 RepID=UPI003AA7B995